MPRKKSIAALRLVPRLAAGGEVVSSFINYVLASRQNAPVLATEGIANMIVHARLVVREGAGPIPVPLRCHDESRPQARVEAQADVNGDWAVEAQDIAKFRRC